jgi:sugar phosphate permease
MAAAGFLVNGGQGIAPLVLVLVPTESVPAKFAATAIGLATLVGEIVGGAMAPALAGAAANRYGLGAPLWIASGGAILVLLVSLFMTETAPSRTGQPRIA